MDHLSEFAALFFAAFLAATLLPGSSEALLAGLVLTGTGHSWGLLAIATAGNTLGSVVNWLCGRFLARFQDRRWFPVSPRKMDETAKWFEHYGIWSLLFAWVPIIGDPITVIAGTLRVPFLLFVTLVAIGKAARYLFVLAAASWWAAS
jgi:membrane protein YqaA with SNARE-associated domain